MKIAKNDIVEVIAGNDRGKRGKVLKVLPRSRRVIVEGVQRVRPGASVKEVPFRTGGEESAHHDKTGRSARKAN